MSVQARMNGAYRFGFFLVGIALAGSNQLLGALGDNAPPIPPTYNTSHPRLPYPNNGFLASLVSNSTALADYNSTADQWDSTNPGGTWQLRRLVIAYLANKTANPGKAATYLAKIEALANLGGTWGPLLYSVNDGVGNGSYVLTSASANFLTGCNNGSCQGNYLSIQAQTYTINSVTNAHTVMLSQSNPPPNGTNLSIRIFVPDLVTADLNIALIYDWLYNDLDPAIRAQFLTQLEVLCTEWEEDYVGIDASPYNDVFYIETGTSGLIDALVLYPDHPNGLKHLNFMMDVWFNVLIPVWRQVFGPEGGGWHESWTDYVVGADGNGLSTFIVPSLLSWQSASGDQIFGREAWLKNFAYFTMYLTRPDYVMESIGDDSRPYLIHESPVLGSLNGLAEIYNDPVLRGWARIVNAGNVSALPGYEPSAWPFYTPDNSSNPVSTRAALPNIRNFPGWGLLSMRTGWTEDDTSVTLKYGDNFWSHEHFDTGAFTIFSRGLLALDSGSYRSGSLSKHENQYARQTIAHNTLTVTDPADDYPSTTFTTIDEFGNSILLAPPNDGGQRRVGTLYNEHFPQLVSPDNIGDWLNEWDYYHMGTMVAYAPSANYTYTAVDITAAYNNKYSAAEPNASNRTYRVQSAVRHLLFVPRGKAAYVIVFDQVTSTNASFVKRWLLHTVNQPIVNGNRFEITRNELVTSLPFVDLWPDRFQTELTHTAGVYPNLQYQYDGKLYGWMVQPQSGSINVIGGPGKEFWVADPLNPGTGTNWNQCMLGQCAANTEGLGPVDNFINPQPNTAPHEPGSWRIEVTPSVPATQDFFLHVMLATTTEDRNVPVNATVPANLPAGMVGATWTDNLHTYTVMFPQSGVGGHITITGAGGVDQDLMSAAQPVPAELQIVSGASQSASPGSALPEPLIVVVKDSAGNPLPNVVVHFGVTQGSGRISIDTATTDNNGQVSVTLTLAADASGLITAMADVNGLSPVTFLESVSGTPVPVLTGLTCSPSTLAAGATSQCSLSLSQAAGAGGATVSLSSSSQALTVPPAVSVQSGNSTANFSATAGTVLSNQIAIITASLNSSAEAVSLNLVTSKPAPGVTLTSLSCAPATLTSNERSRCVLTWSGTPSPGTSAALSSSSSQLVVPSSVALTGSAGNARLYLQAGTISSNQTAIITASVKGSSQTASLDLVASKSAPGLTLTSLSCSPSTLASQATSACTVAWSGTPSAGTEIVLSSSSPLLVVPSSVPMTPGSTSAGFSASVGNVTSAQTAVITAKLNSAAETASLTLIPPSGPISLAPNTWTLVRTNGYPVQTVGYEKLVYAPGPVQKAVMLGNYHIFSTEPNQALIAYDFDSNRWDLLDIGDSFHTENMPDAGHSVGAFAYDPTLQTFIYYCCASGSNQPQNAFGTWWYDFAGQAGRNEQTSPKPGTPVYESSAFDSLNNSYVLEGGNSFEGTWTYNPGQNAYQMQTPAGTPPDPSVNLPAMTYSNVAHKVYLFGGQIGAAFSNDLFTYDVPSNTWTRLNPSGTRPSPRWRSGLAYDSTNNVLLLYGGQDSSQVYNDTWIYSPTANKWSQLTLAQSPGTDGAGPFENLAYDSDHNVFILVVRGPGGYAASSSVPFAAQTWIFRYLGSGPNPGTVQLNVQATVGSINQNTEDWAKEPSLAGSGNTLYAAWVETGAPFDNTSAAWFHVYAKEQASSEAWDAMGGSPASIDSEFNSNTESHSPSFSVVAGVPWISWYKWNTAGLEWSIWAKSWNGSSWQGGPIGIAGQSPAHAFQSRSQIADVAGAPYIAFLEVDKSFFPQKTFLYVKQWNGRAWILTGNGPLNINSAGNTTADSVSIASDGKNPYVTWTEYTSDNLQVNLTAPQVHVAHWDGSQWVTIGGSLNVNANSWANDASIAYLNGQPYVAWTERTVSGNNQIFVKIFNGTAWVLVGSGTLNRDANTGWAFRPTLVADSANEALYLAWVEQQNLGQRAQTYVSKFSDGVWTTLGNSLNADAVLGSAQRASLAVVGGQPVAAWGEVKYGSLRQVFVKKWTGSGWTLLSGSNGLTANNSKPAGN